ncbi:MAG: DUF4419 domain-containing protein, partial [Candidatus Melainabacteria bacterium]|nr:DUF4419 domain-containing protein [Candidatus Melainabacteria bacterium]
STTSEVARLAMLAAFTEICSPFYSYSMYCCGFPAVKLLGTKYDWDSVIDHLARLAVVFGGVGSSLQEHLSKVVLPVAERIRIAFDGGGDPDWFKAIFTEETCGSGSQVDIDGWFCRLFMVQPECSPRQLCNFATHVTRVPYTTFPSQTRWTVCFGLFYSSLDEDGFAVPEFSWVQNVKLEQPKIIVD